MSNVRHSERGQNVPHSHGLKGGGSRDHTSSHNGSANGHAPRAYARAAAASVAAHGDTRIAERNGEAGVSTAPQPTQGAPATYPHTAHKYVCQHVLAYC